MNARTLPAPLAWALLLARMVATAVVVLMCGLALWSLLPRAIGWSPTVIMTGSMQPRLHPGDVVLSAPAKADQLHPGQVVLVKDPAKPGRELMHRFVRFNAAGELITKGDANRSADSTPVPRSFVRGLPQLRLPYIGLGVVWLHNRSWGRLGLLLLGVLAAFALLVLGGPGTAEPEADTAATDIDGADLEIEGQVAESPPTALPTAFPTALPTAFPTVAPPPPPAAISPAPVPPDYRGRHRVARSR